MTRSVIHVSADMDIPAEDDTGTVTLFRTLRVIHSGKIYGLAGKLIVDAMASILILLIISGSVYWFTSGLLKRISGNKIRSGIKRTNRSGRVPGRLIHRNLQMSHESGTVTDHISGHPGTGVNGLSSPFEQVAVAWTAATTNRSRICLKI
jgi:hypothetical protein